jgi:16S rRNA pseudouridine516 synthase
MRLDRLLGHLGGLSRQDVRRALVESRVRIDGRTEHEGRRDVRLFERVTLDGGVLQAGKPARYFMLHKPAGFVSATDHANHPTVLDLLDGADRDDLHLAGRLDLTTTGLMLLTNDGAWSRRLTLPGSRLGKTYLVETERPITGAYVETFARGLHFAYEDLVTLPARLELIDDHRARLTLYEGRYHQVKRMFGHFRNRVVRLHRERVGPFELDPGLLPGGYRPLTAEEARRVQAPGHAPTSV